MTLVTFSKGCLDEVQTIQSLTGKARFNYLLATEAVGPGPEIAQNLLYI